MPGHCRSAALLLAALPPLPALAAGAGASAPGVLGGLLVGFALAAIAFRIAMHRREVSSRKRARALATSLARLLGDDTAPGDREGTPPEALVEALVERLAAERAESTQRLRDADAEALALHARADAALREKSRFMASVGHDLRQPIHAMGMAVRELADAGAQPTAAVACIDEGIASISRLLESMLELSRLEARLVQPTRRATPLWSVFSDVEARLGARAASLGTELVWRPGLAVADTDPALLARLLEHLVGNAITAAPGGRVLVTARFGTQGPRIEVRDNGIGIAPVHHERVFDGFFQVDNPERDRRKGFGLGLPIAARIAELLGTHLVLRSALQRGSTLGLALASADGASGAEDPTQPARRGPGLRCTVVGPPGAARRALLEMLRRWGLTVDAHDSVAQAQSRLRRRRRGGFLLLQLMPSEQEPDAVVASPWLEGLLAWHAGTDASNPSPGAEPAWPAILLAATGQEERARALAARHAALVLPLPVPAAKLRALLSKPLWAPPSSPSVTTPLAGNAPGN